MWTISFETLQFNLVQQNPPLKMDPEAHFTVAKEHIGSSAAPPGELC